MWPPRWRPLGQDPSNGVIVTDCPPLKPGSECAGLCNGKCPNKHAPNCEFIQTYRRQLEHIELDKFMAQLESLKARVMESEGFEDVDFAFIVFETPQNICSERGAIQDWLRVHGIEVEEWKKHI